MYPFNTLAKYSQVGVRDQGLVDVIDNGGYAMVYKYQPHTREQEMGDLPMVVAAEIRRLLLDFSAKAVPAAAAAVWTAVMKEAPDCFLVTAASTWAMVALDTMFAIVLALKLGKMTRYVLLTPCYKLVAYTVLSLGWLLIGLGSQMSSSIVFTVGTSLNTYFLTNEFLSILAHADDITDNNLKVVAVLRNIAQSMQSKCQRAITAAVSAFTGKPPKS